MRARLEIPPRWEAAFVASLLAVWFTLLFATPHVSLPIPPYRDQPDAALSLQGVAYAWAALLLLLPFLLIVSGWHLAVRTWVRGPASRLLAVLFGALSFLPIAVMGIGILRKAMDPTQIDSAASPLFYWWPH